jgi:hypothetical protein
MVLEQGAASGYLKPTRHLYVSCARVLGPQRKRPAIPAGALDQSAPSRCKDYAHGIEALKSGSHRVKTSAASPRMFVPSLEQWNKPTGTFIRSSRSALPYCKSSSTPATKAVAHRHKSGLVSRSRMIKPHRVSLARLHLVILRGHQLQLQFGAGAASRRLRLTLCKIFLESSRRAVFWHGVSRRFVRN